MTRMSEDINTQTHEHNQKPIAHERQRPSP